MTMCAIAAKGRIPDLPPVRLMLSVILHLSLFGICNLPPVRVIFSLGLYRNKYLSPVGVILKSGPLSINNLLPVGVINPGLLSTGQLPPMCIIPMLGYHRIVTMLPSLRNYVKVLGLPRMLHPRERRAVIEEGAAAVEVDRNT